MSVKSRTVKLLHVSILTYLTADICGEDKTLQSFSVSGSVNEVEIFENNTVLKSLEVQVENLTRFNVPETNNYETLKVTSSKGGNQSLTLRAKALKVLEINLRFERIASFQEFSFIGIKKVVF